MSEQEGVPVYRYRPSLPYHILEDADQPMWRRLLWHARDLMGWRSFRVMKSVLAEVRPDMVVTHNLRGMGMSVMQPLKLYNVPWTHVLHDVQLLVPSGLWWQDRSTLWQSAPIRAGYQAWMRSWMGSPACVIGPTNYVIDTHVQRGYFSASKHVVLQNPVAFPDALEKTASDTEALQLLSVGQLSENKGIDILLRALEHVKTPVELQIVGSGPEEAALTQRALALPEHINVALTGRIPHQEVFDRMARADAFVFPSLAIENCPGVLLEARSVGAKIIASDVGGVSELVHESGLVPPGDVRALSQKIEDLKHGGVEVLGADGLLSLEAYIRQFVAVLSSVKRS